MSSAPSDEWLIIVSPVSGKRTGLKLAKEELLPHLQRLGIQARLLTTERAGHAIELAKNANGASVVAIGGDGTISEVIRGLKEAGILATTKVGILSTGTMNFYGVCAGLPTTPEALARAIAKGDEGLRASPLMLVDNKTYSFEAVHFGGMSHAVCKGAGEWRSTMGPMFGIFLHLLAGNAFPRRYAQRGTLRVWPADGRQAQFEVKEQDLFWAIITHRNPYNGAVGEDCWLSWMTMDDFPGFGRMMAFFEPEMEHFQGTSRCFGNHVKIRKCEFEVSAEHKGEKKVALVIDGDAIDAGSLVTVEHVPKAWRVAAGTQAFPATGSRAKATPKPLSSKGKAWLEMHPPPEGVEFFPAKPEVPEVVAPVKHGNLKVAAALVVAALLVYVRAKQTNKFF